MATEQKTRFTDMTPEQRREYNRVATANYRARNPEHYNAYQKRWTAMDKVRNPEKYVERNRRRNERRRAKKAELAESKQQDVDVADAEQAKIDKANRRRESRAHTLRKYWASHPEKYAEHLRKCRRKAHAKRAQQLQQATAEQGEPP